MAIISFQNVKITGISACVPKNISENKNSSVFENSSVADFISATGIERRRVADNETCTSDLCYASAVRLIDELGWDKNEIDCLVFVTQTPDYIVPATSPILQDRLGLSMDCYTLDISLGCSGWVYGLSVIASLMSSGGIRKGLLCVGDTLSKFCSVDDKSTYPLFGDAGTVTALEYQEGAEGFKFNMNSDGRGAEAIMIEDGGYRNPVSQVSFVKTELSEGITKNKLQLHLDGMDVFSFGISKAPKSVQKLIDVYQIEKESVDAFVFHQANKFMNEKIRKKLKIDSEKVPYSLKDFGNTSGATIPLTMVTNMQSKLRASKQNIIASGFGVGLSWGAVYFSTQNIVCTDLIEL